MSWELPSAAEIGGEIYSVNSDYRDILDIINCLNDKSEPEGIRLYIALKLFYEDFDSVPEKHREEAVTAMMRFINCGEETEASPRPSPKRIDWEQDKLAIVSDVNKVAGCEVRALSYLHWWTFVGYFSAVGEGQLSSLVSVREKLRKGQKLDDWEREFYAENKERVDFKRTYTLEEERVKEELLEKLRSGKKRQ